MKWREFAVYTTDAGLEPVCAALTAAGLDSLSVEESPETCRAFLEESAKYWDFADMEHIGSDRPCVKAYAADDKSSEPLFEAAEAAILRLKELDGNGDYGELSICISLLDEEDWANNWKRYYKPLEIGSKLLILPSWEPAIATTRTTLRLDPGMAFGTGAHHTTRMCLELLEKTVAAGDSVLDLGCGSGILSIAALLLGAKSAVAADIDPIAESIARENARLNGIDDDSYRILIGNVLADRDLKQSIEGRYPIVTANIVADVIIALAPLAKRLVQKGGTFITSGIISDRAEEVRAALKAQGFELLQELSAEDWHAFLCRG
ncbi:MAG: 50S ribosomal protein L11 methyltransferase [Clostridia bacterium]|nr:50S ribosomal protein L11 methyltransferase [Clostridia bacterium]